MSLQKNMFNEQKEKTIFDQARDYAYQYMDQIDQMDVFPSKANLDNMQHFEEPMPVNSADPLQILDLLQKYGAPATTAQTGGRFFGYVDGGAIPTALAAKWMSDVWDQCGGLYTASPINAKLETVCEQWLKEIFRLPDETVAGFVSGTSMANLSALIAARFRLLKNQGWDVNQKGMMGAPRMRVVAHREAHASINKTLALIGIGRESVEWIDSDDQGRMVVEQLPELDNTTLIIAQAGNVNSGAFDPFEAICDKANKAGAWVHIDGAFGLWAAASQSLSYLTKGMEKANSWAVDGHKTLNTPYDSGIVLCTDRDAMVRGLQATGADYLIFTEHREPILYGPEMSKRSRAIELWATMKYLGKTGIDEMITQFHERSKQLASGLKKQGFNILNDVVFNQVVVTCENETLTKKTLELIQQSGDCWCSGSTWRNQSVIRMSTCSWATTVEDIDRVIQVFVKARESAKLSLVS